MKQNRVVRMLFSVTGLMILSKLLGFVKQMVVASRFGATLETDLINLSQGFIGNLQYLLVQSLLTSFVAVYLYTRDEGEGTAKRFACDVLKAVTLIAVGVTVAVVAAAPWLSRLLAPTYDAGISTALCRYLQLFAPVLLLFVWIALFNALLHANKRFVPGEVINLNQSLWILVIVGLWGSSLGVNALVVSFFAYAVWNTAYTAFLSRRYLSYSRGNPFRNPAIRRLLRMMVPLMLGYSLVYVNQMVDKILVSGLDTGSVTALQYGSVLSNLVTTFIVTFASIFFPYITDRITQKEQESAAALTIWTAQLLLVAFLPVSIITVLCAGDIVSVIYGRGAFDARSVMICAKALKGYGLMFVPLVLREVYSRFLYGYQDSKRPMINSSIGIAFNIVLSILLCPRYGVIGVTFASSVSVAVCGVLNVWSACCHNTALRISPLVALLPWLLSGGIVCGLVVIWLSDWLGSIGALPRFMLTSLISLTAYAAVVAPLLLRLYRQRPAK